MFMFLKNSSQIASLLCSNLVLSGQTKSPNSEVSLKFRKNFLTPWPLLGLEPTSPHKMRNKWSQGNLSTQSSHFLLLDHTLGILCPNGPKLISKTCIRPFPDLFFKGQIALSISVPLAQRSGQGTTVCRGIDNCEENFGWSEKLSSNLRTEEPCFYFNSKKNHNLNT